MTPLPPPDRSTIQIQQFSKGWSFFRPNGSWSRQLPLSGAIYGWYRWRGLV